MISNFRKPCLQLVVALLLAIGLGFSPALTAQSVFHVNKDLYSETADPSADIAAAIKAARAGHKRILLEFGGNWCSDCQLLDYYYHQSPNAELLAKHYVIVRVEIGHMDHNMEIAQRYQFRSREACRRWRYSMLTASCSTPKRRRSSSTRVLRRLQLS